MTRAPSPPPGRGGAGPANERAAQGEDRTLLANERTEYAEDRTVLANERTYAAWIRTGLAALAAGLGVEKFMADVVPAWGIRVIAVILILFAVTAFYLAAWRYSHLGIKFEHAKVRAIPSWLLTVTSILLIGAALLALAGLWLVVPGAGS